MVKKYPGFQIPKGGKCLSSQILWSQKSLCFSTEETHQIGMLCKMKQTKSSTFRLHQYYTNVKIIERTAVLK